MKVEIVTKEKQSKQPTYPYLGIHVGTGAIVLFTEADTGVCLKAGSYNPKLGEYYEKWNEHWFHPFEDKLVLEN